MQGSRGQFDRRSVLKGLSAAGTVGIAGCLGGDNGGEAVEIEDEVTIQFWEYFGGTEQDEITQLVDEFNEEHDEITVELSNVPFDEFFDALFTAVASEDAPHVTTYWMSFANYMVDQGAISPIDDFIEVTLEDYYESARPAMQVNDEIYSLPMDVHGHGLYSNDTVLEEAGVEEIPDDWDSFQEACNMIAENTEARPFVGMLNNDAASAVRAYFNILVQSDDPHLVEETNDSWEVLYDETVGGVEAAEVLHDITGSYNWDSSDLSDPDERLNLFLSDEVGFFLGGNWMVNDLQNEEGEIYDDLEFTFSKPYVFPGGGQATFAESTGYFFPADGSHTDEERTAAVRFAEWITQNNPLWAETAGHLPAAIDVGESEAVTSTEYYADLGIVSTVAEMAEAGEMIHQPHIPADLYSSGIANPLVDVYTQNAEPEEAVQASADALRNQL